MQVYAVPAMLRWKLHEILIRLSVPSMDSNLLNVGNDLQAYLPFCPFLLLFKSTQQFFPLSVFHILALPHRNVQLNVI